tara:strand:+ start:8103 stop:8669 length:567 start_codon:yes stop_codon:yes gene_type:complete
MKKILFLGYNSKKTRLIKYLKKNHKVTVYGQKEITKEFVKNYDLLISFGYKKIIRENVLKSLKRPGINLHISYLPYNRGAHPNFWSFIDRTPKGVSIHEINTRVDAGNIIKRKKIDFKLSKNLTFEQTYKKLIIEIEKFFIKYHESIIEGKYRSIVIKKKGTIHKRRDLPKNIVKWNIKIQSYLEKLI